MRNLKRALSLALASVMLMGMMVVGTGAAFADESKIDNAEAATVLNALEIMVGDGTNFIPDRVVTRAEMAQILCKATKVPAGLIESNKNVTKFADVEAGAWYAGAIEVARLKGWVAGYTDGNFGVYDTVTTAQAALMIQKALGYWSAEDESLAGKDMLAEANSLAYEIGMMDGMTVLANDGLVRDNVAGMIYNAMTETVPVVYSKDLGYMYVDSSKDNGVTATKPGSMEDDCLFYKFVADTKSGEFDVLGRPMTKYLNDDGDVIVEIVDKADLIYIAETAAKDIKKDLGKHVVETSVDASATAIENSLKPQNTVVEVFFTGDLTADTITYKYLADTVKSVDEDENDDDEIVTTVTLDGGAKYTTTDAVDFAEGDIVAYVMAGKKIATIELADTVAGEITATAASYIRLDGVKYTVPTTDLKVEDTGVIAMDPNGNAIKFFADEKVEEELTYAYVTDIRVDDELASGKTVGYADLVLADASKVTVSLDMSLNEDNDDEDDLEYVAHVDFDEVKDGKETVAIYSYVVNDGLYGLTAIAQEDGITSDTAVTGATIGTDVRSLLKNTLTANDDTIYVDVEEGVVYVGFSAVADYTDAVISYVAEDGVATIIYITGGKVDGAEEDATYVYITNAEAEYANDVYTYIDAIVDGEKVDLVAADEIFEDAGLYQITEVDADGNATKATPVTFASKAVYAAVAQVKTNAIYSAKVTVSPVNVDSKTVYIVVENDDDAVIGSASDIIVKDDLADGQTCSISFIAEDNYASIVVITIKDAE